MNIDLLLRTSLSKVAAAFRPARIGLLAAALVGGGIGGTGGLALAAGPWHGEHRLGHLQAMVAHALDRVGATSAQEAKIHDIIAAASAGGKDDRASHEAARRQMIDLLKAPTIDQAAVEKLRADQVAAFDARSKAMTAAMLDAASQLSADQRVALADQVEHMMARHHHDGDGPDGWRHGHHGPDGNDDRGPDGTPAPMPDKG